MCQRRSRFISLRVMIDYIQERIKVNTCKSSSEIPRHSCLWSVGFYLVLHFSESLLSSLRLLETHGSRYPQGRRCCRVLQLWDPLGHQCWTLYSCAAMNFGEESGWVPHELLQETAWLKTRLISFHQKTFCSRRQLQFKLKGRINTFESPWKLWWFRFLGKDEDKVSRACVWIFKRLADANYFPSSPYECTPAFSVSL